jgi:hypothetical protein
VLAALHDLETGRALWTYNVRITLPGAGPNIPELSDDGRFALVLLPPSDTLPRSHVGLLSMRDGSVQQIFPVERVISIGFARGSDRLWIRSDNGVTGVYALN